MNWFPEVRTLATVLWCRTGWHVGASVSEGNMSTHLAGSKQCVISETSVTSLQPIVPIFRSQTALSYGADWYLATDVSGQLIGTIFKSQVLEALKMEPIGCPETSVTNHQYTLSNIAEQRGPHLNRCGSRKSSTEPIFYLRNVGTSLQNNNTA